MKRGDIVNAEVVGEDSLVVSGIVTRIYAEYLDVQIPIATYQCFAQDASLIPDCNVRLETEFYNSMRERHSLDWYGTVAYPRIRR
jgi:hypothetical protein